MANIKLDEKHRIKSDSRQWIFQSTTGEPNKDGDIAWSNIGYYSTLTAVVNASYAYFLRKSDADSIVDFMEDSKRIFNRMVETLSPVMEIKEK